MIHHNTARKRIGFYLINTSRPRKQLGINACISSRITTVIQVVKYYQINYNWYNEPFAVSQYKLFILRHAWLNLWDKHMTTGRINQVAAERVQVCLERRGRLSWRVGWYQRSLSRRSGKLPWWECGLYFFKVRPRTSFELVTQIFCVAPLQPSEPPKDIASLDSGSGKQRDSLHRFLEAFCLEALLSWSRLCDRAGTMGAVRLTNSSNEEFICIEGWGAIDPYDPQIIN